MSQIQEISVFNIWWRIKSNNWTISAACKFIKPINNSHISSGWVTRLIHIFINGLNIQAQLSWIIQLKNKDNSWVFQNNFLSLHRNHSMSASAIYLFNLLSFLVLSVFEKVRTYFGAQSESIPMSFVLGFYVSYSWPSLKVL